MVDCFDRTPLVVARKSCHADVGVHPVGEGRSSRRKPGEEAPCRRQAARSLPLPGANPPWPRMPLSSDVDSVPNGSASIHVQRLSREPAPTRRRIRGPPNAPLGTVAMGRARPSSTSTCERSLARRATSRWTRTGARSQRTTSKEHELATGPIGSIANVVDDIAVRIQRGLNLVAGAETQCRM